MSPAIDKIFISFHGTWINKPIRQIFMKHFLCMCNVLKKARIEGQRSGRRSLTYEQLEYEMCYVLCIQRKHHLQLTSNLDLRKRKYFRRCGRKEVILSACLLHAEFCSRCFHVFIHSSINSVNISWVAYSVSDVEMPQWTKQIKIHAFTKTVLMERDRQ